jgi:hypothetical protein
MEQPMDLHKYNRRVQSNTFEFTKLLSLVLRILKKFSHISYKINVFTLQS